MHDMELELRRLENERDELTSAYKEAESVSRRWDDYRSVVVNLSNISNVIGSES